MARNRTEPLQDRILRSPTGDPDPVLFRVAGVEPHGWSTVLIEDRAGTFYVVSTATGHLTPVAEDEAARLIEQRTFRRWHGDRTWTVYEQLPLIAQSVGRQLLSPSPGEGETTI